MTVVTIEGLVPIPLYNGLHWATAHIQEAPAYEGPWTEIDTIPLDPIDPDPTRPIIRNLTTDNATLDDGWYRIIFEDSVGASELPTQPINYIQPSQDPNYLPTVRDVATWIVARTKDKFGNEIGTFNSDTRPTGTEVVKVIQMTADDVAGDLDTDIPSEAYGTVQSLIALGAAMRIELSYFPEQVGSDNSPYDRLKELYDDQMRRAEKGVARETTEESENDEGMSQAIKFQFPAAGDLWTRPL